MRRLLLAASLGLLALVPPPAAARAADSDSDSAANSAPQAQLPTIPLRITPADGKVRDYRVELARTAAEQARGMMFRTRVPPATGMLFPFDPPAPAAFWMKNTLVPLDIIFIGPDSRVQNIAANAEPLSERPLASHGSVRAVLELAGGEAARIGLRPGDRVQW